ncbi:MAG: 3-hydroxyacyl-CoA dehydrogenase NAD-binding domain-containing protein [Desulfobacterales bacterium]|jgi:3-hydroxypropionate dehydrogenase (NADP+)
MRNNIETVACVGAGLIGQGWATLFAAKGYDVIMQDLSEDRLENATAQVNLNLKFLENNGRLQKGRAAVACARIRTILNLADAVKQADYIQESVPDNYAAKKEIFKEMDAAAASDTILASSSSGLMMTEIQKGIKRPQRCVLTHPFLPVHLLPLVEVVGGEQTAPEAVDITVALMKTLGKTPVRLRKEVSGYIVNRLQAAILREAIDLVADGVASAEEIDSAFCTGMGMRDPFIGPCLRAYLAGDGIEDFVDNYAESYELRWESMAAWSTIPAPMRAPFIKSVNEMEVVRQHSLENIKKWRDKLLVKILKIDRSFS